MPEKEKATIIVFSSDIDKVFAALTIATGALSMNMDVTLFFTFWGLNVIRKENTTKKKIGIIRKLFSKFNKGGAHNLKLSKFNMGGIGTHLMKNIMKKVNMNDTQTMLKTAKTMGAKIVACNTTLEFMGISKNDLINEVEKTSGVATYIADAKKSKINLFI
ncbi:DsrE/DsrF/DrsH-like family protein [bacterium]